MAIFTAISMYATWALGPGAISIFGLSPAVTAAIFTVGRSASWAFASAALNKPQASRQQVMATITQTDAPRIRAYGRNLLGGIRALYEAEGGELFQVVVIHHGQVDGLIRFWVDGEPVTLDGDSKRDRYTKLLFRDGSGIGGNYADVLASLPEIWTAQHRLQGQATFMSSFGDPADEDFQKFYPKGPNTQVQAEIRGSLVRTIAGDLNHTENAGLCTRDLMTHPDGWNIPLERLNSASWASFVALCFQSVPLASGGSEARYRLAGYYSLQDPLKDTTARMLATCDGQIYETADGDIGIIGGQWSEPDVTISGDDILSVQMSDGFDPFTDYNVLMGSFVSPDHGYQPTEVPELVDAVSLLTQPRRTDLLDVDMCPSGSQLQRLMKIKRAKDRRQYVGTLRTNLVGLKARFPKGDGIHTIRVVAEEFGLDGVFEVTSHSFSIADGFCEIGIASIENPYLWDAATEERPVQPTLDAIGKPVRVDPVPVNATLIQERFGVSGGVQGVRIALTVDDPGRDGLELRAQIARGDFAAVGPWSGTQPQWVEMPASALLAESGVLDDGQAYTVRYRWRGYGNWLKAGPITALANPTPPSAPTALSVMATGGSAYVEWINASTGYYRTQVLMGTTTTFADATPIATVAGSSGRPDNHTHAVTGTGARRFWVRTINPSGVPSAPTGPVTATF